MVCRNGGKTASTIERVIWTVEDADRYRCIGEVKVYRLLKEQRLPVIRIGKAWRFRRDLIDG